MSEITCNCQHDHILCIECRNQIFCNNSNNSQFFNKNIKDEKKNKELSLIISKEAKNNTNFEYKNQDYFSFRKNAIKTLKKICKEFYISDRTYFLSLFYLDKIYESLFVYNSLDIISIYCLILAIKFVEEDKFKVKLIREKYLEINNNFLLDEIYILKLLNYNLCSTTCYDILIYLLSNEILFFGDELEKVKKKSNNLSIFHLAIKYLLKIVEFNNYLNLSPFQTAFGIIQIIRKKFGLNEYRKELYKKYINDENGNINKAYKFFIEIFNYITNKNKNNGNNVSVYKVKTYNKNFYNSYLNNEELRI
jgi:hypothetical protein